MRMQVIYLKKEFTSIFRPRKRFKKKKKKKKKTVLAKTGKKTMCK